jgi:hypothetical protein
MSIQDQANTTVNRPYRVVCMYCGIVIHGGPPQPISHGLCAECEAKAHAELDAQGVPR